IIKNQIIINRIQREVDTQNTHLDKTEQIKKFVLIADEWSIESRELSPTLKLRRKFVHEKYNDVIDKIYGKT
ncbi:MAG: long-chain fatty acid--CoA ligase, partial [Bacteroidales bacterium]|nr:long-chain fatty acid--CoA ligase [Bacteroidales bacterium]